MNEQERREFERAVSKIGPKIDRNTGFSIDYMERSGRYESLAVELAWQVWQAARESRAQEGCTQSELDELYEIINPGHIEQVGIRTFEIELKNLVNDCRVNGELAESRAQGVPDVLGKVLDEVRRATEKFPTWPLDPLHALAVLGEEFGELTKAALQFTYEPIKSSPEHVMEEAIQTAAMALRFLQSITHYEYSPSRQHEQEALLQSASQPEQAHGESSPAQPQRGWIYTEPQDSDEDYCGEVWSLDRFGEVELLSSADCRAEWNSGDDAEIIAWMPTGLTKPSAPTE